MLSFFTQLKKSIFGIQIVFVAFGAMVLVPLLTGLNPSMALLGAGIGTLIFQVITRHKVPIFLGSSFAFIAPVTASIKNWGIGSTMFGLFATGFMYFIFSFLIKWKGVNSVHRFLPPVVIGPVVMVIGLSVAKVACDMAIGREEANISYSQSIALSAITFLTTVIITILGSRAIKLVSILIGIIVGYSCALLMGVINLDLLIKAPWFALPKFVRPEVNWYAAIYMLPVAIAPIIEHIGGVIAIGKVAGKDYLKDPGLDKTLAGDGLGVCVAGLIGGPPVTTYAEVTGAVALTKNTDTMIMTWAAIFAICMAFLGKFDALLHTIPKPVMGGVMILLFGTIVSLGVKMLVDAKIDLENSKNLIIISAVLIIGVGELILKIGNFQLSGIGLAAILAIILNIMLPDRQS